MKTENIQRFGAVLLFVLISAGLLWLKADGNRDQLPPLQFECEYMSASPAQGRLVVDGQRAQDFQLSPASRFSPLAVLIPQGPEPITSIRLDPLLQQGDLQVRNARVTRGGNVLATIPAEILVSLNPQTRIEGTTDGWRVRHTSNADYPALLINGVYPLKTPVVNSATFSRGALVLCWTAGGLLGLMMLAGIVRSSRQGGRYGLILIVSVFLVIFGVRLITLHHIGDRVPNWDYWQMPWTVYLPYLDGNLTWQGMIAPVNEHRVFFARLFSLGLFLVNGQWENLYEAAAMSAMHACTATGLALLLWNAFRRKHTVLILTLVIAATALPFSWENIIWANQSQFYFFVGFSILTIWLLGMHRPFSVRWWLGCSAAMAAQFTVGSGMLAPVVVAGLMLYKWLRDATSRRESFITLAAAIALAGFASLYRVKSQSAGMITKNADQFIQTFGKTMSWPYAESIWIWILLWLPLVLFIGLSFMRRASWTRAEAWTVALGGWVLLNALGVGLFRGAFSSGPISRYMDLTAVGMIANGLALFLLPELIRKATTLERVYPYVRGIWLVVMTAGVLAVTNYELTGPAKIRVEHQQRAIENTRRFMQSDDLGFMLSKKHYEIPHPDPMSMVAWLRSAPMRAILPVSIRDPMVFDVDNMIGFSAPGIYPAYNFEITEPTWGSYGREGDRTVGTFFSKPIAAPRYSYLQFPALNRVTCKQRTVTMKMIDPATGKDYRICASRDTIGDWKNVFVRVPKKPLRFEASDNDYTFWVAFQAPREVSTLSYWSFKLIEAGPLVLAAGLIGMFVVARKNG